MVSSVRRSSIQSSSAPVGSASSGLAICRSGVWRPASSVWRSGGPAFGVWCPGGQKRSFSVFFSFLWPGGFQAPGGSLGDPMEPGDGLGDQKLSFSHVFFKVSVAWGRLGNQKTLVFHWFFNVWEGRREIKKIMIVSATA